MAKEYASDVYEIPRTLSVNPALRGAVLELIRAQPIPEPALEGPGRAEAFRATLCAMLELGYPLNSGYKAVRAALEPIPSPRAGDRSVFRAGWAEELVRRQLSVAYNQAVLQEVQVETRSADTQIFVPHTDHEDVGTVCSRHLAGRTHRVGMLLETLIAEYRRGPLTGVLKVPSHPQCAHVVRPFQGC